MKMMALFFPILCLGIGARQTVIGLTNFIEGVSSEDENCKSFALKQLIEGSILALTGMISFILWLSKAQ